MGRAHAPPPGPAHVSCGLSSAASRPGPWHLSHTAPGPPLASHVSDPVGGSKCWRLQVSETVEGGETQQEATVSHLTIH